MIITSQFKSAWWLSNPHAQTVYPTLTRRVKCPPCRREKLELPDGDFLDLVWADKGLDKHAPLVIVLHGLGGSVQSKYVAGFFQAFNRLGWRSVLMHFRGASETPNRLPRIYHSGDTADLNYFLKTLAAREPNTLKAIVGVSLGGNVLLKWLGEQGPQRFVQTAVAVSVPFQLRFVADRLNQGFSRIYQVYLLNRMRRLFQRLQHDHGDKLPEGIMHLDSYRCFWTFDDAVTAPIHGFEHVHAYYDKASSKHYLNTIATPTLIIHAQDDPFMTPDILPEAHELSADTVLEKSKRGGHVGFVSGIIPGKPVYWLDERISEHIRPFFHR